MTKGTASFGKRNTKVHTLCPRCGKRSFHRSKARCASCAFPAKKMRKNPHVTKAIRRRLPGTGRQRYLKTIGTKAKNGFRS